MFGYEKLGKYSGPCLMLVGRESFQFEIENDRKWYVDTLPSIREEDIVIVEEAGHWLHSEKKQETIHSISGFIDRIDNLPES